MKTCFKCGESKPLSEFYPHKRMADGRLGKCKTCAKSDVAKRIEAKQLDPDWLADERARCREKQSRYRAAGAASVVKPEAQKKWLAANPQKRKAQSAAGRAVRCGKLVPLTNCEGCQKEAKLQKHHPDYSKPLYVQWLCTTCHGKAHWK